MNETNGDGRTKRGDILRGILKIRRKRNSSVSKATSRGVYHQKTYEIASIKKLIYLPLKT